MKWYRKILPQLITQLTGQARYLPDIIWSSHSWTHNVFRAWECIAWRTYGIRAEASYTPGMMQFHTWESALAHMETWVRTRKFPRIVKVYLPRLAPAGLGVLPSATPYRFAIAFDAAPAVAGGGAASSSLVITATCTGSNLILWSGLFLARALTGAAPTSQTYAGSAMTQLTSTVFASGSGDLYLGYIAGGATGANDIVWNFSSTGILGTTGFATSFTGAGQSSIPDSQNSGTASASTSFSATTTVVAANCWLEALIVQDANTVSITAPATLRVSNGSQAYADSNGTVGTGSQSIAATSASSGNWGGVIASFAPPAAGGAVTRPIPYFNLLGLGT